MIFTNVVHDLRDRRAFVMTKADIAALTLLGSNRKAPADEQAVRFVVHEGQVVVWATDTTHVVWVEPDAGGGRDWHPDVNIKITARSLKANAPKKASHTLAVLTTGEVVLVDEDGNATECSVETPGPCELGWSHLQTVRSLATDNPPIGGRWQLDSLAVELMGAIAKACTGEVVTLACPPHEHGNAFVFRVRSDLSDTRWNLATMPMLRK